MADKRGFTSARVPAWHGLPTGQPEGGKSSCAASMLTGLLVVCAANTKQWVCQVAAVGSGVVWQV